MDIAASGSEEMLPDPVTVITAVLPMTPPKPCMLALMVVVPAATAVARPDALIVATAGALEVQVTSDVTFDWEEG